MHLADHSFCSDKSSDLFVCTCFRYSSNIKLLFDRQTSFPVLQWIHTMSRSLCVIALLSLSLLASIGCDSGPKLLQVQGKVIVDGTPAKGAVLLFHPDNGASVSTGQAKDDGTFTLVTDTNPGIPSGTYTVTLTWPDPSHVISERDKMTGLGEPGKDLLNGRYVSKDRGIKVEVSPGTTSIAPIELKTK